LAAVRQLGVVLLVGMAAARGPCPMDIYNCMWGCGSWGGGVVGGRAREHGSWVWSGALL